MRFLRILTSVVACATTANAVHAQSRPTIRPLGRVTASSSDSLGPISNIRHLPNGRLLVNDVVHRRVLMLDSTLKVVSVIADSTSATANAYASQVGALIAFRGDSTLFVDPTSLSMLVIDPKGTIGRVMSVPRAQDAMMLAGTVFGGASYDGVGHLVYRGAPSVQMRMGGAMTSGGAGAMGSPSIADSMPIIRVDLATRAVDTAGFVKIPKTTTALSRGDDGAITVSVEVNPLPIVDEWAMTADGAIGIIRGADYHLEWMTPDRTRSTSPKVTFDWKRLTDEDKSALIDSVKARRERMEAAAPPGQGGFGALQAAANSMGLGGMLGGAGGGNAQMRFETRAAPSGAGGAAGGGAGAAGGGRGAPAGGIAAMMANIKTNITYVSPSQLPDYQPPFLANSAKADADGNIWLLTIPTKQIPGGAVYDVINRKGDVVERVQIPENRAIIGFGAGGIVILGESDGLTMKLERARIR